MLEPGYNTDDIRIRTPVETPSKFRLFVFVLPQATVDRLSVYWSDRTVAEEMLCFGWECNEVTTGLYVGDREVQDPALFLPALGKGLGLIPWALPPDFKPD